MTSNCDHAGQTIVQIDAFTGVAFTGNPAAVCILAVPAEESWMQSLALEMNLAETAFVVAAHNGDADYNLRWFTPTAEVKLCGHATLAAAHNLYEDNIVPRSQAIRFATLSGVLVASLRDGRIVLDFPSSPPVEMEPPTGLAEALGAEPHWVGKTPAAFVVRLGSDEIVRSLQPDLAWISRQPGHGVIVTAESDREGYDFISRFFAPSVGVPEDPVTGSAHCSLTPYWAERLGKPVMTGYQASARGGYVGVALKGNRVELTGSAVTVMRGVLLQ